MGDCQSMFSVDSILIYNRVLQNDPFLNSRFNKESLKAICKGTYTGMRNNYGKFLDEKVSLQKDKWWRCLFWSGVFSIVCSSSSSSSILKSA